MSNIEAELSRPEEIEDRALGNFLESELPEFKRTTIQSKEGLLNSLKETIERYHQESSMETAPHSPAYYEVLNRLLDQANTKLKLMAFPDPLPDWWYYSYDITPNGVSVRLNHLSWSADSSGFHCSRDQKHLLFEAPARLLTVSEYANAYGVGVTTVRSWIRRAKIRSAIKYGPEWRIPELAEVQTSRHYVPCEYEWEATLTGLPDEFAFLNEFKAADFVQDKDDRNHFLIKLYPKDTFVYLYYFDNEDVISRRRDILNNYPGLKTTNDGTVILSGTERERVEQFMIGNPLIHFRPDGPSWTAEYLIMEAGSDYCSNFMVVDLDIEEWAGD